MAMLNESMVNTLVQQAMEIMHNAYVPYGKVPVGACILASDGTLYAGCNIENAIPALSATAEAVALHRAVADGKREFDGIAVVADKEEPFIPNGAVCQLLAEFHVPEVVMANMKGEVKQVELSELLPYGVRIHQNTDFQMFADDEDAD